jgi:3-oxoacyl-[acyl-carrier protein] reductase
MDLGVEHKVYLIAGASKGLGFAIARVLTADGAHVSLASRNAGDIEAAAGRLRGPGCGEAIGTACDVRDPSAIVAWVEATVARFGGIDGAVINAGGPAPGRFEDFGDAAWQAAFELTLMSAVRMVRAVLPHLRARGGGSLLTLTSSSIKEPIDSLLLSNVMRSGVVSLAKSLSRDFARYDIRVNNLVPGLISTDRMQQLDEFDAGRQQKTAADIRSGRESAIPMRRYGTPEEFARVGAFLLSPAAHYMTGSTVVVDGGAMRTVW